MEKQYNEELVMNLVKALESALPAGMTVVVGGSATLSDKEALDIIHNLSGQVGKHDNCGCVMGYGENQEWIPDDEEEEEWDRHCEDCETCIHYMYGNCSGYADENGDCPIPNSDEEEDEEEEPSANLERIRELLEEVMELADGAGLL